MSGVVIFDAAAFVQRYPQFSAYNAANPAGLQMFFDEATLLLNNTECSKVTDLAQRTVLLYLLTAHIATLSGVLTPAGEGSTASQVGRIADATEGSVSAKLDMGTVRTSAAYFLQTQYGATYWQLTAKYRIFRYRGPALRCC